MATLVICQRLFELYVAKRNRTQVLEAGAQEFGAQHYPLFFLLHIGWLAGWVIESALHENLISEVWYLWISLFIIAQGLRYWCMISLGTLWNTRILVIPNGAAVNKGPYQFLRHPNYLAVAIELISVPLLFDAVITAVLAAFFNAVLILGIRIPEENNALRLLKQVSPKDF